MSDNKKYYYLKLKENFYEDDAMIVLESMPDGYKYSNILMKLYLRSLKSEGRLMFNDVIPYTSNMLAPIVRHSVGDVEKAIQIFRQLGLIEVLDSGAIYITDIQNFIGKSSTEGDRKRAYRNRIEEEKQLEIKVPGESGQMSGQTSDKRPPELEIELEKDIELETEIKKEFNTSNNNINNNKQTTFSKVEKEFGRPLSPIEMETINFWNEDYNEDMIDCALREAVLNTAFSLKYIEKILVSWEKKNLRTKADIHKHLKKFSERNDEPVEEQRLKDLPPVQLYNWVE